MKRWIVLLVLTLMLEHSLSAAPTHVTRDGYVFGGVVGSIAGFGIGHAVQGRYSSIGWAFSVGEGLGILTWLTIPWIIQLAGNQGVASEVVSKIGMAIFGGFRLWQVTDLWVNAKPERAVLSEVLQERDWQKGWWGAEKTSHSPVATLQLLSW